MSLLAQVRKKLGHTSYEWLPQSYLNTGDPLLNGVLGQEKRGIPYGCMVEIAGMPSNGKTALAIDVASAAQADGAVVVWADFENSFDPEWVERRGLKCGGPSGDKSHFELIQPYVGKFGKGTTKEERLVTGEELLAEIEQTLRAHHQKKPKGKLLLAIDSVTAILPEDEAVAGIIGQNMGTSMALPKLLGRICRRWIALARNYNCIVVWINQLREKPGAWGDPTYTTGGNALPFYCHIRVRMRRVKGGRMTNMGRVVGVKGILSNVKNKAGGVEGADCGFKIFFDGHTKFLTAADVKGDA